MKISKHMNELVPSFAGLKGKFWGYYPGKAATASNRGEDYHEHARHLIGEIGYEHDKTNDPEEMNGRTVVREFYRRSDNEGEVSVVELTLYQENGYKWVHVNVLGDAQDGLDVWGALYE